MTNHPHENELALYSTRDLDSGRLAFIAQHLNECARCRECLAEFDYLQAVFPTLPAEPAANDLDEVRAAVMRALKNEKPRAQRALKWAIAAAAAASVILLFHGRQGRFTDAHPVRAVVAITQHPPEAHPGNLPIHTVRVGSRVHHAAPPGLRSVTLLTSPGREPLIKMTTSDPNVIILLPPDLPADERTESND